MQASLARMVSMDTQARLVLSAAPAQPVSTHSRTRSQSLRFSTARRHSPLRTRSAAPPYALRALRATKAQQLPLRLTTAVPNNSQSTIAAAGRLHCSASAVEWHKAYSLLLSFVGPFVMQHSLQPILAEQS
jgi:hypothetical protein